MFTNRDTNCVALSEDDGATFLGFREMTMNELRNTCDFRTSGGNFCGNDKSVHQFQAVELPYGKVLVHYGQHDLVGGVCMFDLRWHARLDSKLGRSPCGCSCAVRAKGKQAGKCPVGIFRRRARWK